MRTLLQNLWNGPFFLYRQRDNDRRRRQKFSQDHCFLYGTFGVAFDDEDNMPAADMRVNVWLDVQGCPPGAHQYAVGRELWGPGTLYISISTHYQPGAASAAGKRVQIPHKLVPFCYALPSNALANHPDTPFSRNGLKDLTITQSFLSAM